MNDLNIFLKRDNAFIKHLSTFLLICFAVMSLYLLVQEVLANRYEYLFFVVLTLFILSLIVLGYTFLYKPKANIVITDKIASFKVKNELNASFDWSKVTDMGIGVASLRVNLNSTTKLDVNLAMLKYDDIKEIKSKIIELCENKNIPFANL